MGRPIGLDQLRPLMVLAADIVDSGGRLLLPAGTALSEKHLRFCQMWGVTTAEIETGGDEAEAEEPAPDPGCVAAARLRVLPRYRHVDQAHPVIEALIRHAVHVELARPT